MRHEATLATLKVAPGWIWLSAWLGGLWGWLGQINWAAVTGAMSFIYTVLMTIHLLKNWNKSRDTPNEPVE